MKIDPQLVIEVLGEEVGRTRAEFVMELEKKIDSAVALAAMEVLRNQIEAVRAQIELLKPDEQLRVEITGIQDAVKAGHDRQIDAEEEFIRILGEFTGSMDRKLDALEQLVTEKPTADDLKTLSDKTWDEVTGKFDAVNAAIEAHAETVRTEAEQKAAEELERIGETMQQIADLRRDLDEALDKKINRGEIIVTLQTLREDIDHVFKTVAPQIEAMEATVADLVTKPDLQPTIDALKHTLDLELADKVAHSDSVAAIDELKQLFEPRIDQILQRLAGIDADMAEIEDRIDHRTDAALESWRGEFDDLRNRLRTTMLNVQEWQEETTKEIDERLADIKDGEPGPQGEPGRDGKDGAQGPQGPAGKDGKHGKDGERGQDAVPWDHLGTYDPAKAYRYHDSVIKDGGSFLSKANNNTTVPGESPLWQLMAARGQRGKPGEPGPQGLPGKGLEGPQGAQGEAALPFVEVRALEDGFAFIREDGEIFECNALPLLAHLRGDIKNFIVEQVAEQVDKAIEVTLKTIEDKKKK